MADEKPSALERLRTLALRAHDTGNECDDPCMKIEPRWPYNNPNATPPCDCGADEHNAEVERVFTEALREVKRG